ncbi:MAG: cysteine--tRNA ligase [Thermoplasmata archaeon]|nr:cysteine--tRNA ligase [Thermoplasmata archaeon]
MKIYDTLSREKKEFIPLEGRRVKLFVCGPTVYDYSHIGHARTYVFFDTMASYLRYRGYHVFYLQNITDIDDKIINRGRNEGRDPLDISMEYTIRYFEDMASLRIDSVNIYAPATYYMDRIIDQILRLEKMGFAYETEDGVYFNVLMFKDYGKLSHQSLDTIRAGARVEVNENKRHPADFALWKKRKEGEPYWESPWGDGRPGWHIEDTAITEYYFGPQYDIHGGGSDLIFPHHECEIAQMESVSGKKPMVNYWMHTGLLTIKQERMGKSMGNVINIRDILEKFEPELLRFFLLSSHYRSPVDFSYEKMEEIRQSWEKIVIAFRKISKMEKESNGKFINEIRRFKGMLIDSMDDDFNTPEAISSIQAFVNFVNKNMEEMGGEDIIESIKFFNEIDSIFKIIPPERVAEEKIIDILLKVRQMAREKKMYDISDYIREKLRENNINIEDIQEGQIWYKK